MNLAMKIKFPKKVRAALREFSKVDREAYIQNAVANQLAKDGRIAVPSDVSRGTVEFFSGGGSLFIDEWSDSDTGQKETEPVTIETPKPVSPVSAFDFGPSSGGSSRDHLPRYQDKGLEAMYREGIRNRDWVPPSEVLVRSPDSGSEQKEPEPVSETSRVNTLTPVEGTVPFSYSCSSGSGSGFVGDEWSDSDSDEDTYPYQEEWRMVRERQGRISFSNRDQIPPSEVLDRSPVSDAEQKEPEPVTSETPRPIHPVSDSGSVCSSGGNSNDHLQHSQREWSEVVVRQGNWLISHRFQQSRQNR